MKRKEKIVGRKKSNCLLALLMRFVVFFWKRKIENPMKMPALIRSSFEGSEYLLKAQTKKYLRVEFRIK